MRMKVLREKLEVYPDDFEVRLLFDAERELETSRMVFPVLARFDIKEDEKYNVCYIVSDVLSNYLTKCFEEIADLAVENLELKQELKDWKDEFKRRSLNE